MSRPLDLSFVRSSFLLAPRLIAAVALSVLAASGPASPAEAAVAPSRGEVLSDFDARRSRGARQAAALALLSGVPADELIAAPPAEPGRARQEALASLERTIDRRVVVRWDEITGSPRFLAARSGFLREADGRPPVEVATDFLLENAALWALDAGDLGQGGSLTPSHRVPLAGGGHVVHFEQRVGGLEVLHGHLQVALDASGRVVSVSGGSVSGAGELPSDVARHAAGDALKGIARAVGLTLKQDLRPAEQGASHATFDDVPGFERAVTLERIVAPTGWGPRLAWRAWVHLEDSSASYEVAIDDARLQPLWRATTTWHADTRARVFEQDPLNGLHVVVRWPDTEDFRSDRSPLGWAAADMTVGNNAVAREDLAGDDEGTVGLAAQAAPAPPYVAFDFPFISGDPAASLEASITNLFHGINLAHDRYLPLGFDEASGNFQADNLGLGGLGGDAVLGDAQDGSGTNNANFQTAPDGFPSRMQMFVWDTSGTLRPSSFDQGIVVHEYGHGVSTRLVGGPDRVSCLFGLQGASMGEGWSDLLAASLFDDPVIGAWASGSPDGIRMFGLDENPASGKDYRDFCTYEGDLAPTFCEPHDNGEMWAGFLWLVRDAYVAAHGVEDGVELFERLVLDGMKLTPCSPSMVEGRDALVIADRAATGGTHECLIKEAARDRWIGFSAASDGGSDAEPTAADDPWPECGVAGKVTFTREGVSAAEPTSLYHCGDVVRVAVTDGNAAAPMVGLDTTAGDAETLALAPSVDPAVFLADVPTAAGAPMPGDGVLQVASGDVITAAYADPDLVAPAVAVADVSCTPRLVVARHFVRAGSCDDDTVEGYEDLPGFVDAGEVADVEIHLANPMAVAFAGAVSVVTDRPDLLTVLPTAPIPVEVEGAIGPVQPTTVLMVRVAAEETVVPGDVATLELTVSGPGYDTPASLSLPLRLALDYELTSGLTVAFDVEAETGGPVGPDWTTGTTQPGGNEWTLVACSNTTVGGTQSYRNGPPDCTGEYTDAQGAPFLATPLLDLGSAVPDPQAARITNVSFQHDVDLGAAGAPVFGVPELFDAEAVGLLATGDPAGVDTTDPFSLVDQAIAVYANLGDPVNILSNTDGWEPQSIDVGPLQLQGVDLLGPARLAWYFLTDVTPDEIQGFPFSAQGDGYYLDDLVVTYEVVDAVPQATACTLPPVVVLSRPLVTEPASGVACAGDAVAVDASLSEADGCAGALEYRFLIDATPVACFDDAGGMTARTQDADGWGASALCHDFPSRDTTYAVEVRCSTSPDESDTRTTSARVLDGTPLLSAVPAASCPDSPAPILLDASTSALVGCPGDPLYRFADTATGTLFDCDGDTMPDDFGSSPTCEIPASGADLAVTLEVSCDELPGCVLADDFVIPALSFDVVLVEVGPGPGPPHCPDSPVTLDASMTTVEGCADGTVEYRFTTSEGFDSGWISDPNTPVSFATDGTASVSVRCSLNPECVAVPGRLLFVPIRDGNVDLQPLASPDGCAGDPVVLDTSDATTLECTGAPEFRFLEDGVPLPCPGADAEGWTVELSCETPMVAGGADYVVEMRCPDDPACVFQSGTERVTPDDGVPDGAPLGTLLVSKTTGCPGGSADVVLEWPDSGLTPRAFVLLRDSTPQLRPADHRAADIDDISHVDAGAACDGSAAPWRGATVRYYSVLARNTCTNDPIP